MDWVVNMISAAGDTFYNNIWFLFFIFQKTISFFMMQSIQQGHDLFVWRIKSVMDLVALSIP